MTEAFSVAQDRIIRNFLNLLLSTQEKDIILQEALNLIVQSPWLPIEPKGGIFLTSQSEENLIELYISTENFSPELLVKCAKIKFGQCICGKAAEAKKIIFVDCVDSDHDIKFNGMAPHGHYSVPFLGPSGNLLGILILYVKEGHVSTDNEVSFLTAIANTIGAIIDRLDQQQKIISLSKSQIATAMAVTLGHEINNPLAIAYASAGLLEKNSTNLKNIGRLMDSLNRINETVKKIQNIDTENITFEDYAQGIEKVKID